MKKISFIILSLLVISACQQSPKKENIVVSDPKPKKSKISIKEVSRVALVEAQQFLSKAKDNGIDFTSVMEIYNQSKQAYDSGNFKQSQVLAVKVRHMVEDLLIKK